MRLAALLLLCKVLPAAACPLPAPVMQQGEVQATWQVDGGPIAVGRHFAIDVRVCPESAVLARVDATMPEHQHGMNYRPSVQRLDAGRWRVEGLMFHMPGRWQLRLDVVPAGAARQQLIDTILLR